MTKTRRKRVKLTSKNLLKFAIVAVLVISIVGAMFYWSPPRTNEGSQNGDEPTSIPTPGLSPTYTVSSPIPTPTVAPEIKIVNKQIPSGYEMGFPIDGGLRNGMNALLVQNAKEKVSIRFTAKLSGSVNQLAIYAFAYQGNPTVNVGLQEDSNGLPTGQWMNNAYGTMQLDSGNGFKTLQLGSDVSLNKGKIYHVVIELVGGASGEVVAVSTYQANGSAQPFNPDDPDITWSDPQMNTMFYDGSSWKTEDKWPIFVVGYSDGSSEGQPYSIDAQWVVTGSTYVGQTLIPASDYKLGKISFDVSLGSSGVSQGTLSYQIRDSGNKILAEGLFNDGKSLTVGQSWAEVTLSTPVTLLAGHLYRIVLLAPQTDMAHSYYLYGHEFCYDQKIGFGSLQHQLTSSLDAGLSWGENPDADAIFKLTTV